MMEEIDISDMNADQHSVHSVDELHCYVCLEAHRPLVRPCACINTVIHPDCLRNYIVSSRKLNCSICKIPFEGVEIAEEIADTGDEESEEPERLPLRHYLLYVFGMIPIAIPLAIILGGNHYLYTYAYLNSDIGTVLKYVNIVMVVAVIGFAYCWLLSFVFGGQQRNIPDPHVLRGGILFNPRGRDENNAIDIDDIIINIPDIDEEEIVDEVNNVEDIVAEDQVAIQMEPQLEEDGEEEENEDLDDYLDAGL